MLKHIKKNTNDFDYPDKVLDFDVLDLDSPVIFFTGENGSGKSTLLKVLADLSGSIDLGKSLMYSMYDFSSDSFSLAWSRVLRKGYYFQSEDFYLYLKDSFKEREDNKAMLKEAEERHGNRRSLGYYLESGMHRGNTEAMDGIVQEYLYASHGEGYIRFFQSKLRESTLYLLDEPETPLSFQNQLTLIKLIDETVKKGSQFIICTHSPILLSYPGAKIIHFAETIQEIQYKDHPLVHDYKRFLENPERYYHYLLSDEE